MVSTGIQSRCVCGEEITEITSVWMYVVALSSVIGQEIEMCLLCTSAGVMPPCSSVQSLLTFVTEGAAVLAKHMLCFLNNNSFSLPRPAAICTLVSLPAWAVSRPRPGPASSGWQQPHSTSTVQTDLVLLGFAFVVLRGYCVFHKWKVCDSPASNKTIGAIFPTHLLTLCLCVTFW